MLRHNANAKLQADFLKSKVAEAQKTLHEALITTDTVSKEENKTIDGLEKSVEELKKTVEELKASKSAVDKAVLEEKKANLEARETIATWRQKMTFSMPRSLCWRKILQQGETLLLKRSSMLKINSQT